MRRNELITFVTNLVTDTWNGADEDVAAAVLADDDALVALAYRLQQAGGDADGMTATWSAMTKELDDDTLDWIVDRATSPAGFLASRVS